MTQYGDMDDLVPVEGIDIYEGEGSFKDYTKDDREKLLKYLNGVKLNGFYVNFVFDSFNVLHTYSFEYGRSISFLNLQEMHGYLMDIGEQEADRYQDELYEKERIENEESDFRAMESDYLKQMKKDLENN